jgi:hypothetical protein
VFNNEKINLMQYIKNSNGRTELRFKLRTVSVPTYDKASINNCIVLIRDFILSSLELPIIFFLILYSTGCRNLVEVSPPITFTNAAQIYTDDTKATAVLTAIYNNFSHNITNGGTGLTGISLYTGLSSDELTLFDPSNQIDKQKVNFFTNTLSSTNVIDYWTSVYPIISTVNSAIEGLSNSDDLTPEVKRQLLGEAMFIRAFCYFYLVNLYGEVPLAITTDYKVNSLLSRASIQTIYNHIILDLKESQNLLNDYYVSADVRKPTLEKVRPNKWVATALLSRCYLYLKDYENAELQATLLIDSSSLFSLSSLNEVFLKNSSEAIWQLQPVNVDQNTSDALIYILPPTGPDISGTYPVYLSQNFIYSFEAGDKRKIDWIDSVTFGGKTYCYPYKYKINLVGAEVSEYIMVFRLGEQYLIRAESRAQQNNLSGAAQDLNIIRNRARAVPTLNTPNPLPDISPSISQREILETILQERKIELFTEWGHRWFDLKRTGYINEVMSISSLQKGGTWNSYFQLYPITLNQLSLNPNLKQNPGYN